MSTENVNTIAEPMPRKKALTTFDSGSETILRDPATNQVHFLNPTAVIVWECCDGQTTVAQCEARIRDAFTLPGDIDVAADIARTLKTFRDNGLVDEPADV